MAKFKATITRYISTAETLEVEVEAPDLEAARELVEDAYSEGDYDGEGFAWEEDADSWDAYAHETDLSAKEV